MKKVLSMAVVAVLLVISGCDNQAKQRVIEKQRQEDSIRIAENVKKELAEKAAKERAVREKEEAEKRAAREAAEKAERESKTWTGASSVSELRRKLDGTSWETTYEVLRTKIVFSNGKVKMIDTDLDGNRYKSEKIYNYEIKEVRGSFVVNMGYSIPIENTGDLEYSLVFKDNMVVLFSSLGVNIGKLEFLGRN